MSDAPRQPIGTYPGWYFDGDLPEPRLKLKGTGTLNHGEEERADFTPETIQVQEQDTQKED